MIFKREDFQGLLDFGACAEVANSLLDAHLATLPKVIGYRDGELNFVGFTEITPFIASTKKYELQALLWDVKPIEKKECEHEPIGETTTIKNSFDEMQIKLQCAFCGIKLKATWSPA